VESILTQDTHDPALWRIITTWESPEAIDNYYRSNGTMLGAYIIHLTGVVPTATMGEVVSFG
jgi:hypothetical protein